MSPETFLRLLGVLFLLFGLAIIPRTLRAAWAEFITTWRWCRSELKRLETKP